MNHTETNIITKNNKEKNKQKQGGGYVNTINRITSRNPPLKNLLIPQLDGQNDPQPKPKETYVSPQLSLEKQKSSRKKQSSSNTKT